MRRVIRAATLVILGLLALWLTARWGPGTPTPAEALSGRAPDAGPETRLDPSALELGEPHLASFIALDINDDYGVTLVVEPQTSDLAAGSPGFLVLNKWTGLSAGLHRERVQIFSDGETDPVYETGTEFRATGSGLSVTVVEAVPLEGVAPGLYWVQVELDGRVRTAYPFRVIEP